MPHHELELLVCLGMAMVKSVMPEWRLSNRGPYGEWQRPLGKTENNFFKLRAFSSRLNLVRTAGSSPSNREIEPFMVLLRTIEVNIGIDT